MKLCKDCFHFRPTPTRQFVTVFKCRRPLTAEVEPVYGAPARSLNAWASDERKPGRTLLGRQRCGPDARFFHNEKEPVEAEPTGA